MSLPRYPEYKDSGVEWLGAIPSSWTTDRLKRRCHVFPSNVDKKSVDGERAVRLCNYTDVYYSDRIAPDMSLMDATATDEQIAKFTLRAGDTVFTKDSESAGDIGVAAFVPSDLPGIVCGYHLSIARPIVGTNGAYVKWLFDARYTKARFAVLANGLTRVGLTQYVVDNIELPWPPFEEQVAIASFLDRETAKIDALIAEQEKLLALLAEKRQATISHAVTRGLDPNAPMKDSGIPWLGDVPAHWAVAMLRRFVVRFEQGWSPECESRVPEAGEWGVLKAGCVNGGTFNAWESKALPSPLQPRPDLEIKAGDVLMSRASGSPKLIGSVAYIEAAPSMLMLSDKIFRLGLSADLDPEFFVLLMGSQPIRQQIEQAIGGAEGLANNLPQSSIKDFWICVPPVPEQKSIVDCTKAELASLRLLAEAGQRTVQLLTERRSALIAAAVTGQIDVRGAGESQAA